MNNARLIGMRLLTAVRIKIPLIIGIFFLLALMLERVELDAANPDVDFLVSKTSVHYLNYDFHIVTQPSRLTVKVKANLEVAVRTTHILYFVLSNAYRVKVQELKVNTYPVDFAEQGGLYRVELPFWYKKGQRLELALTYTIASNFLDRQVVAKLNADWYPKNLLPELVTARFRLDVPGDCKGIANGALVNVEKLPNRMKRYSWLQSEPITNLGISIGKYQLESRNYQGRLFWLFYLPGLNKYVRDTILDEAKRLGNLYYSKFGGRKLNQLTLVFGDSAWEETSCGTLIFLRQQANYNLDEQQNLFFKLAHELSHFWWGNQVTPKHLDDWWLVEGFANYSALLATDGLDATKKRIPPYEILKKWCDQYKQTMINIGYYKMAEMSLAEIGPFDLQRELLYSKGAFVLQMIAHQIGPEKFDRYLAEFVRRAHRKKVGIDEFTRLGAELYGAEMVDFFRQWIYSTGTYNLALRDLELIRIGDRYRITVNVLNTGHLYLPNLVDMEIITKQRVYTETLRLTGFNVKMQKVLREKPLQIKINAQPQILETEMTDNVLEIR